MEKDIILFDLDGTIIDPKIGITESVKYALDYFDIKVNNLSELYKFIGPPLKKSFMNYYGFNEKDAKKAVEKYRERFSKKGIYESVLYDGVIEILEYLKSKKKFICIATSKPLIFTKEILKYFNILKYFDFISASELNGSRSEKTEIIKYIIDENNINQLEKMIMIGDRCYDIIGAKENNIESIGVLYGYGNIEELEKSNANYIIKNIKDIKKLIKWL